MRKNKWRNPYRLVQYLLGGIALEFVLTGLSVIDDANGKALTPAAISHNADLGMITISVLVGILVFASLVAAVVDHLGRKTQEWDYGPAPKLEDFGRLSPGQPQQQIPYSVPSVTAAPGHGWSTTTNKTTTIK